MLPTGAMTNMDSPARIPSLCFESGFRCRRFAPRAKRIPIETSTRSMAPRISMSHVLPGVPKSVASPMLPTHALSSIQGASRTALYRTSAPQAFTIRAPGSTEQRERAFADPAFALYRSEARVWSLSGFGVYAFEILLFLLYIAATAFSITAGYHRHFAHGAYECRRFVKTFYPAVRCGRIPAFGAEPDVRSSPPSPKHRRGSRSLQHQARLPVGAHRLAHGEAAEPRGFSNIPDLVADPSVRFQHRHYVTVTAPNLEPSPLRHRRRRGRFGVARRLDLSRTGASASSLLRDCRAGGPRTADRIPIR
jgi:hypothetical protein